MRTDDQTYHLIEDFLAKKLDTEKLQAFMQELAQSQELRSKVEAHKLANELVIENRLKDIKGLLHQEKINSGKTRLWKKIISGITGGLLIASLLFFMVDKNENDPKDILPANESEKELRSNNITDNQVEQNSNVTKNKKSEKRLTPDETENNKFPVTSDTTPKTIEATEALKNHIPNSIDESVKQNPSVTPVNISCDQIDITANVSVKPACEGDNNGAITLSGFKGGTAPYHFEVTNNHDEFINSQLPAGNYSIIINDSKGCKKIITHVDVAEKICQKDYSFNPSIGESWDIPSSKNSGTLILYDESGNVYFTQQISSGAKEQWSGQSKNGEVKTGYFLFTINYNDGTTRQGSVTIVR
jgi:hypothetical protein